MDRENLNIAGGLKGSVGQHDFIASLVHSRCSGRAVLQVSNADSTTACKLV
jgi:hypothetical protein